MKQLIQVGSLSLKALSCLVREWLQVLFPCMVMKAVLLVISDTKYNYYDDFLYCLSHDAVALDVLNSIATFW